MLDSFDLQPRLKGALVELRPLRADDYDVLYAVAADPEIWAQHPASDRHEPSVFRRFFDEGLASSGALIEFDAGTVAAIGSSRYAAYDAARRQVEIGWTFLARSHWGGRYNGEMKQLMLQHAFRVVERVLFRIGAGNRRSQRAVEKVGGVRIGTERAEGTIVYVYAIDAGREP